MNKTHYTTPIFILLLLLFNLSPAIATTQAETFVPLHVHKGTNLISIARKYCKNDSDWKSIAQINNLKSPYTIYSNTTLQIPLSLLLTETISAKVAAVSGSPMLFSKDSQSKKLVKGSLVLPGDTIKTKTNEFVHLVYPNHKHTRIGPQSEMTLVYLMRLADGSLKAEFSLKQGSLLHKLHEKLKANEHFQTRTPVAIAGVRGTEFRIKMVDEETNIVETLKGVVTLDGSNKQVLLIKGTGSKVIQGHPPTPPQDLPAQPTPPNVEAIYYTLPIVLDIPQQANTEQIRIKIAIDPKGNACISETLQKPGQEVTLPSLDDGKYYLFFTAIDSEGFEGAPTNPVPMQVHTSSKAPVLSSTNDSSQTLEQPRTIQWSATEPAKFYNIELATSPDFLTPILKQQTKETQFTTGPLTPGTYYFRVQLVTETGFNTLYSEPFSWTVLAAPQFTSVTSLDSNKDATKLEWLVVPDATSYSLQIAQDREFNNIVISEEQLSKPSYSIDEFLTSGKYYVRINADINNGQRSPWSSPKSLTIAPEPLGPKHIVIVLGCLALMLL